jgi:RNA-directed DNA polymerase
MPLAIYPLLSKSEQPGGPKLETVDFLGFTHIGKRSRKGNFVVHVRTMRKRLRRSLKSVTAWCREHRHDPVDAQQEALNRKLRGHYQYYGRSTNLRSLVEFFDQVRRIWHKWLNRRSRGNPLPWPAYVQLLRRNPLSRPRLSRPWKPASASVSSA